MKVKTSLLALTLSAFASSAAFAAVSYPTDDTGWKPEPSKTTKAEAKKAEVKKPVKRHSHVEEKTGMPAPQHSASTDKNASMKRKEMHDHTRDRH
jgi:hypothetical protein